MNKEQMVYKHKQLGHNQAKIAEIFIKSDRKSLRKIAKHAENSDQYFEASKQEFEKQMKMVAKEINNRNNGENES